MFRVKKIKKIITFLLLGGVLFAALCILFPKQGTAEEQESVYKGILRVWQIDGIEGGQGSRASFLARVASSFEGENEGLFVLVSAHTAASAKDAIDRGELPDVLSFSGSCAFAADFAQPLKGFSWKGTERGGDVLAYPWCRGNYFLFSTENEGAAADASNTVLSVARETNVYAAAYYAGLRGECEAIESSRAYLSLLGGECRYLLGTQRDFFRLRSRGFAFRAQPLQEYSDLWQYACVFSKGEMAQASLAFVRYLLSEKVQSKLGQIGMLGVNGKSYGETEPVLNEAEKGLPARVPYAWLSEKAFSEFCDASLAALAGEEGGAKKLQNYLV